MYDDFSSVKTGWTFAYALQNFLMDIVYRKGFKQGKEEVIKKHVLR